jgi:molybdopterin/thiamine biosynthesis adenylyltransferase
VNSEYREIFSRNLGFYSEVEQETLQKATIAVAGMGGVGGLLAERLIRAGVGHLKITDSGTFEKSNLNRQFASSFLSLGQNKATSVFRQIKDINPEANIQYYENGLKGESDIDAFIDDCDVVVDEMDTTAFKQSILLQRASRRHGLHYLFSSALGFGALVAIFDPEGQTLEDYNGLAPGANLDRYEQLNISFEKAVPMVPSYANAISSTLLGKIMKGEVPIPTTSIGVGLASIMGAIETINIVIKKKEIIIAPKYICLDLLDLRLAIGTMS